MHSSGKEGPRAPPRFAKLEGFPHPLSHTPGQPCNPAWPAPDLPADALPRLSSLLRRLGLQHRKAAYLHLLSRQLVSHHQGDIPDSVAGLTSLPGVGSKIAHLGSHTALHCTAP